MMKTNWPRIQLGSVVTPVKRAESPVSGVRYRQIGVRLWGEGAYERDTIDGGATRYKYFYRTEEGDIIVNKIWARNGSVAVVSDGLTGCYASGEFPMFAPDRSRLLPRWFHWFTKTKDLWRQCDEKSRGTSGKNRIRPEKFLEVEIPLPSLAEQQRIVARIDALAARIAEAKRLRAGALAEVKAVMGAAARQLLSQIPIQPTALNQWLGTDRQGIQTGPFGAQLGSDDFVESGIPVITIGNVQYSGLELDALRYVNQQKAESLSRYDVQAGDILFARMGTVGRCCVVPAWASDWLYNYHLIRVVLDKSVVLSEYVHWSIRASSDIEEYLGETIRGATRQGVNQKIVGGLPIRVPSLENQRRIVAYLDGLQAKVDAVKRLQAETQAELDALLPSMLDRAFRGEL